MLSTPPRGTVMTCFTSDTIGSTSAGGKIAIRNAMSSLAIDRSPMKAVSELVKIRNGKIASNARNATFPARPNASSLQSLKVASRSTARRPCHPVPCNRSSGCSLTTPSSQEGVAPRLRTGIGSHAWPPITATWPCIDSFVLTRQPMRYELPEWCVRVSLKGWLLRAYRLRL